MASKDSFLVLVHYRGSIKKKTRSGIKFTDKDLLSVFLKPTMSVKRVEKLFYRISILVLRDDVKYDSFVIGSDEDLEVLFYCRWQFFKVKTPELLAKLVDVVSSSGATAAYSSSRHVGASSFVPVIAPEAMVVATPSFAADLNRGGDENLGGIPDGIDDVMWDDDDDHDVEPNIIADDNGDNITRNNPAGAGGVFSSRTQQYPPHFSILDLDAMNSRGFLVNLFNLVTKIHRIPEDKEEAVLSYKVVEFDYRKYFWKGKEFGNRCTWLIRISLRQRRCIWEVKRYNGPHTCLATSISSDHKSLDYRVISVFILPIVRVDAAVCIKVLLNDARLSQWSCQNCKLCGNHRSSHLPSFNIKKSMSSVALGRGCTQLNCGSTRST
ncbi:hypothetical protein Ahy_A08g038479 [Arachis hypogaea]|uniref:Transposase MuDR plant domain-containing protein n=1 Tax=Arachis hypogaea TaxID=3818 RepID=A0A445BTT4_ARAHY|nr:hypothetical protein Ahy_A08g038479 [Arachis hypogaea]